MPVRTKRKPSKRQSESALGSSNHQAATPAVLSADAVPKLTHRPVSAFLRSLYSLVDDNECNDLVHWGAGGRGLPESATGSAAPGGRASSFVIEDRKQFASTVLPRFFNHRQFSSFTRQLNFYCFERVGDPKAKSGRYEYSHPSFVRGQPELLCLVVRKTNQTGKRRLQRTQPPSAAHPQQQHDGSGMHSDILVQSRSSDPAASGAAHGQTWSSARGTASIPPVPVADPAMMQARLVPGFSTGRYPGNEPGPPRPPFNGMHPHSSHLHYPQYGGRQADPDGAMPQHQQQQYLQQQQQQQHKYQQQQQQQQQHLMASRQYDPSSHLGPLGSAPTAHRQGTRQTSFSPYGMDSHQGSAGRGPGPGPPGFGHPGHHGSRKDSLSPPMGGPVGMSMSMGMGMGMGMGGGMGTPGVDPGPFQPTQATGVSGSQSGGRTGTGTGTSTSISSLGVRPGARGRGPSPAGNSGVFSLFPATSRGMAQRGSSVYSQSPSMAAAQTSYGMYVPTLAMTSATSGGFDALGGNGGGPMRSGMSAAGSSIGSEATGDLRAAAESLVYGNSRQGEGGSGSGGGMGGAHGLRDDSRSIPSETAREHATQTKSREHSGGHGATDNGDDGDDCTVASEVLLSLSKSDKKRDAGAQSGGDLDRDRGREVVAGQSGGSTPIESSNPPGRQTRAKARRSADAGAGAGTGTGTGAPGVSSTAVLRQLQQPHIEAQRSSGSSSMATQDHGMSQDRGSRHRGEKLGQANRSLRGQQQPAGLDSEVGRAQRRRNGTGTGTGTGTGAMDLNATLLPGLESSLDDEHPRTFDGRQRMPPMPQGRQQHQEIPDLALSVDSFGEHGAAARQRQAMLARVESSSQVTPQLDLQGPLPDYMSAADGSALDDRRSALEAPSQGGGRQKHDLQASMEGDPVQDPSLVTLQVPSNLGSVLPAALAAHATTMFANAPGSLDANANSTATTMPLSIKLNYNGTTISLPIDIRLQLTMEGGRLQAVVAGGASSSTVNVAELQSEAGASSDTAGEGGDAGSRNLGRAGSVDAADDADGTSAGSGSKSSVGDAGRMPSASTLSGSVQGGSKDGTESSSGAAARAGQAVMQDGTRAATVAAAADEKQEGVGGEGEGGDASESRAETDNNMQDGSDEPQVAASAGQSDAVRSVAATSEAGTTDSGGGSAPPVVVGVETRGEIPQPAPAPITVVIPPPSQAPEAARTTIQGALGLLESHGVGGAGALKDEMDAGPTAAQNAMDTESMATEAKRQVAAAAVAVRQAAVEVVRAVGAHPASTLNRAVDELDAMNEAINSAGPNILPEMQMDDEYEYDEDEEEDEYEDSGNLRNGGGGSGSGPGNSGQSQAVQDYIQARSRDLATSRVSAALAGAPGAVEGLCDSATLDATQAILAAQTAGTLLPAGARAATGSDPSRPSHGSQPRRAESGESESQGHSSGDRMHPARRITGVSDLGSRLASSTGESLGGQPQGAGAAAGMSSVGSSSERAGQSTSRTSGSGRATDGSTSQGGREKRGVVAARTRGGRARGRAASVGDGDADADADAGTTGSGGGHAGNEDNKSRRDNDPETGAERGAGHADQDLAQHLDDGEGVEGGASTGDSSSKHGDGSGRKSRYSSRGSNRSRGSPRSRGSARSRGSQRSRGRSRRPSVAGGGANGSKITPRSDSTGSSKRGPGKSRWSDHQEMGRHRDGSSDRASQHSGADSNQTSVDAAAAQSAAVAAGQAALAAARAISHATAAIQRMEEEAIAARKDTALMDKAMGALVAQNDKLKAIQKELTAAGREGRHGPSPGSKRARTLDPAAGVPSRSSKEPRVGSKSRGRRTHRDPATSGAGALGSRGIASADAVPGGSTPHASASTPDGVMAQGTRPLHVTHAGLGTGSTRGMRASAGMLAPASNQGSMPPPVPGLLGPASVVSGASGQGTGGGNQPWLSAAPPVKGAVASQAAAATAGLSPRELGPGTMGHAVLRQLGHQPPLASALSQAPPAVATAMHSHGMVQSNTQKYSGNVMPTAAVSASIPMVDVRSRDVGQPDAAVMQGLASRHSSPGSAGLGHGQGQGQGRGFETGGSGRAGPGPAPGPGMLLPIRVMQPVGGVTGIGRASQMSGEPMSPAVGGPGIADLLPDGGGSVGDDRYSSASMPRAQLMGQTSMMSMPPPSIGGKGSRRKGKSRGERRRDGSKGGGGSSSEEDGGGNASAFLTPGLGAVAVAGGRGGGRGNLSVVRSAAGGSVVSNVASAVEGRGGATADDKEISGRELKDLVGGR